MKPFPGPVEMTKGKVHRILLNNEQREWLCLWFPTIENKRLANAMGISLYKLHDFANHLGLTKSEKGLEQIHKRRVNAMVKANHLNGCYDRKRGHAPSSATLEGNRRRWEEVRKGLRETPAEILKRNPKKYKQWIEKRSNERKESIRKEKMRLMYGLERKTKLKIVVLVPYKRSQIHHRCNALKRGYLLDVDCSEGSPGRYVIYYDDQTQRNERFEQNCIKDGFTFKRDE